MPNTLDTPNPDLTQVIDGRNAPPLRYVSIPSAIQTEARIVHECFMLRERHMSRLYQSPYRNLWHSYFAHTGKRRFKACLWVKRLTDSLAALLLLLAFSPLLISIILMVKVTSPGPILYKSLRIGRFGQPFHMLKFRSMIVDADNQRAALRQHTEQQAELFKMKNDPRITPIGSFLRKYSLDELPQLINVLRGDMSLVGPRPFAPDDARLFEDPYTLRFEAIPGMTGLWQVSGRSDLNFNQLCKLDLTYTLEWSLLKDIKILFKTIPVVFGKVGAF